MRYMLLITIFLFALLTAAQAQVQTEPQKPSDNRGYLENPPVYISNLWDIPLDLLDADMPHPRQIIPYFDLSGFISESFNKDGVNVQPALDIHFDEIRLSALYGFNNGLAGGISIPWRETQIRGAIGGLPASADAKGIAQISFFGKKTIWKPAPRARLVATAGIELPNGHSDYRFRESNAATNGYYRDHPQVIPIGWQPDSGTTNGYLALAYRRQLHRFAYEGLIAGKLYSSGLEDSKVGNIFIASAAGTYGVGRKLAVAMALTLRAQGDDSYPNAPAPGVDSALLAGTTTHGTMLLINPSIRYNLFGKIVIGGEYILPVIKPDNGMVPAAFVSVIFSPSL